MTDFQSRFFIAVETPDAYRSNSKPNTLWLDRFGQGLGFRATALFAHAFTIEESVAAIDWVKANWPMLNALPIECNSRSLIPDNLRRTIRC